MASVTQSFSQFDANVKAVHTGIIATGGHLSLSATFSPSGILNMTRLPHGATVLDYWIKVHTGGASQVMKMGTAANRSCLMAATTLSLCFTLSASASLDVLLYAQYGIFGQGMLRHGAGDLLPARCSLSDDAAPRHVNVTGKLSAGCSDSAYFTVMLFYTMDGMAGRTEFK